MNCFFQQAVCDHKCRFIHCYAGNVGSVHDQRVFRLSELKNYLDDATKFPNNTHLIGDSAYTLHEHLMVPYRDNGHLTQKQKNFNFCHSSARMAIERSFGFLKGRFRSLLTTLDMKRVDLIPKYIIACCILHNIICLLQNYEFPGLPETTPVDENIQARGELVAINRQGAFKRDNLCDQLPFRHI
ncbi:protein ALP1-like [Acyrthosiphon pisum]|uniref:DDE Tnp4 domain-containing protein n=1 Tax=Acyrthosiphon pisum TaxID=7029 RepID=A0A8R2NXD5_ACYPI|nr:protein ALP1-like [Acyrthosiphon pisum]